MDGLKVKKFMQLAGQELPEKFEAGDEEARKLGAQLLLSEVLEYVIHGLGVTPSVNGEEITEPDRVEYSSGAETRPCRPTRREGDQGRLCRVSGS